MTNIPAPVDAVEDDPGKPWKAIAAAAVPAIVAAITAIIDQGGDTIPPWLLLLLVGVLAGLVTFTVKNPKQLKR